MFGAAFREAEFIQKSDCQAVPDVGVLNWVLRSAFPRNLRSVPVSAPVSVPVSVPVTAPLSAPVSAPVKTPPGLKPWNLLDGMASPKACPLRPRIERNFGAKWSIERGLFWGAAGRGLRGTGVRSVSFPRRERLQSCSDMRLGWLPTPWARELPFVCCEHGLVFCRDSCERLIVFIFVTDACQGLLVPDSWLPACGLCPVRLWHRT